MAAAGTILLFVDLPDGEPDETGRGLLSYGGRLGTFLQAPWEAVTTVTPEGPARAVFGAYGTPRITAMTGSESLHDTPALLGKVLGERVGKEPGTLLVLPHNDLGATLAPVVAATVDGALLTEVTAVREKEGEVHLSRQALGSRVAETRVWDRSRPLVITVPVRSLSQVLLPSVRPSSPLVTEWQPPRLTTRTVATVVTRIPPDPQTVDLTEAEVIFSAGKGCDTATFDQLKELCRLLNVSFGVTRPVFDLGWTGFERMVGQTGRTVTPRFYLALGISGSMHHVGGIKDSKRIVSVNTDPKAPIFPNSDEGFVADLRQVLPLLLDRAHAVSGGAA